MKYFILDSGEAITMASVKFKKGEKKPVYEGREVTESEFSEYLVERDQKILLEAKNKECSETILARMSDQKQKNLNVDVNRISIKINLYNRKPTADEMLLLEKSEAFVVFRDEVLLEYRTNKENADFTRFK